MFRIYLFHFELSTLPIVLEIPCSFKTSLFLTKVPCLFLLVAP